MNPLLIFVLIAVVFTTMQTAAASTTIAGLTGMQITPTPTPQNQLSTPLDLSKDNALGQTILNKLEPTIQELVSANPEVSSILVNFTTTSDISAEYDPEDQKLTIVITAQAPIEEPVMEEQAETEVEESNDNGGSNDNGDSNNEETETIDDGNEERGNLIEEGSGQGTEGDKGIPDVPLGKENFFD